ncbi:MAG: tetratricopeptide repeat protein [Spirochaetaceae bacterium]|nr:tetratricopeptide repeat protein [Myxococcales bacterium]MCB9723112.1 tetratricopeptide repeat protein [Spirochaetaceae bacterium]HPG25276.1 tetratricopeptide repeat protein [Myxococcota bacterium]
MEAEQVYEEARSLMAERRFAEGLEKMRALVDANPDDPDIQMHYGEALIAAGQPSLAVWPLSRAMRDPDHLVPAGLLLARAQVWAGSAADAIQTATRVLDADAENKDALLIRIEANLRENMEERALEDLDRAEALGLDPARVDLLRLDALLGLEREAEAEALLAKLSAQADEMRETDPENAARVCAGTATFTYERGDLEGAKKAFEACLDADETIYPVLSRAAIAFFDEIGEPERSLDVLKRRFEYEPERLDLRVQYVDRLQAMGRKAEAEGLLLQATETQPDAWAALTDLYATEGDIEQALGALDRVIAADPTKREDRLFTRADFLLALGRLDEAERILDQLEVPAHRALIGARIAYARGDVDRAIEHFEEGIRLWPDNPDARFLAARAYEKKGEWAKAAAHYREGARLDTPHYESSMALAGLQQALGDVKGVHFLLARLADKYPSDPKVMERVIRFGWDTGSAELAGRMLNQLSRIPGQSGRAAALLAGQLEKTEGPEAALAALDKTKFDFLAPVHFEALEARMHLLVALDREQEALGIVGQALERSPGSPDLLMLRASVHEALGDIAAARADLEAAGRGDPTDAAPWLKLARLAEAAGDKEAARALYEKAVPLEAVEESDNDIPHTTASVALGRLELDAGELDAARERLRGVLSEDPRNGRAAWLLLQCYETGTGSSALGDTERKDLAVRASLFDHRPETVEYLKRIAGAQG